MTTVVFCDKKQKPKTKKNNKRIYLGEEIFFETEEFCICS